MTQQFYSWTIIPEKITNKSKKGMHEVFVEALFSRNNKW